MAALALLAPGAGAQEQTTLPANDLNAFLGLTGVAAPANLPVQRNAEPPLEPVPRARCGPGSQPLEGEQGRVPASAMASPQAARGWWCNVTPVGRYGAEGGWRTWRYVDRAGRECAYYDTAVLHPFGGATVPGLPGTGIAVLDMSDPSRPVQTALLDSLPMQGPHESLNVNTRRGLLAANMGNGGTAPGLMSIYEVAEDCRHPVHASTTFAARFGHESGFSPDGRTYWVAGGEGLAAIDVSDPRNPVKLWEGASYVHGLSLSADGNRLYIADPINGHLVIADSSDIQARRPDPEIREISRLTWGSVSIPQGTAPMTIDGHPYVLEFDEFAFRFTALQQDLNQVGAARIIDIADEARPRVVSNLRLEVNQRDRRYATFGDPNAAGFAAGYSAHYCAIPREVDPQIVACSFINSGLRVFDIRDPLHPREVAYYVAPPARGISNLGQASNYATSQPAFAPERREVWYTDMISGLHVLRLSEQAWPDPLGNGACRARDPLLVRFAGRPALRRVRATVAGRRARVTRVRRGVVRVDLSRASAGEEVVVVVRALTRGGRRITVKRTLRLCAAPAAAPARGLPLGQTRGRRFDPVLARSAGLYCRLALSGT